MPSIRVASAWGVRVLGVLLALNHPSAGQAPLLDSPLLAGEGVPDDANGVERAKSILERRRPDYEPAPITLGDGGWLSGFVMRSSLGLYETYDGNIYRAAAQPKSDLITTVAPSVAVSSNFYNHALEFAAKGQFGRHLSATKEDFDDYELGLRGRYDASRDLFFIGGARAAWLHEDRGSPDDRGSLRPITYRMASGNLGGRVGFGDFGLRLLGSFRNFEYDNSSTSSGVVSNAQRNRTELEGGLRFEYAYAPNALIFARALTNQREYELSRDARGFARSSHGGSFAAGLDFDFGGLVKSEVFLGFGTQRYDDERLKPFDGLQYGASLLWSLSSLTSLRVAAARTLEETTVDFASGRSSSSVSISLEHELLRNVVLSARSVFGWDDYVGVSRLDKLSQVGVGALYLMNRSFSMQADVSRLMRTSSASGAEFEATIFNVRFIANF